MEHYTLGAVERRFADLIWAHEPIPSGELVKLCETELHWKKIHHLYRSQEAVRKGTVPKPAGPGHLPPLPGGL